MKIQIVARNNQGCDWFRCILPAIHMQQDKDWMAAGNSVEMLWIAQDEWQIDCDILIYNKLIATPVHTLKEMQAQGMKIIVDIDDLWELPTWNVYSTEWNNSGNDKLTLEHIRIADIVTCTSMRLQNNIREYNKNTIVIPNAMPYGDTGYNSNNRLYSDKLRFLYAGGAIHLPDVKLLEGKFKRIGSDGYMKSRAEFILAGYDKARMSKRMYSTVEDMKARNDKYTTEVKDITGPYDHMRTVFAQTGSYRVINTMPVHEYISCYDHADIVLAPLIDNEWNSYKSNLKLLEAATRELPVICSAVSPYIDDGIQDHILWVYTPDDWLTHIKWCIRNPQGYEDKGKAMAEYIKTNYNLDKWNEVRKQVYSTIV